MIKSVRLGLIASAAILLASTGAAAAQTLWRGSAVGERPDTLRRRFPGAAIPQQALVLSAGEVEGLRLVGQSLEGAPVQAHFFFRDGRLSSVQLRAPSLLTGHSGSNLDFVRKVAGEITAAGGAPYNCVDNRFAAITRYECKWLRGEVVVHESYLDVAGQAPVFYVAFRRADDPAFDS